MKKTQKYILIILLIMVSVYSLSMAFTLAKYAYNATWDYYLQTQGFYFSSDYLEMNTKTNIHDLWNGETVYFNIKNNQNELLITEYDISYQATCEIKGVASSQATCHLNGTDDNTITGVLSSYKTCINLTNDNVDVSSFNKTECELNGYNWENQITSKDLYFDVIMLDDETEISSLTVSINVVSTDPYHKSLKGDFVLGKIEINPEDVLADYQDNDKYGRLTLTNTYPINQCIKVIWSSDELVIDEEYDAFSEYNTDVNGYINEIKISVNPYANQSFIYYKLNENEAYDLANFTVELTECETEIIRDLIFDREYLENGLTYVSNGATIEVTENTYNGTPGLSITGRPNTGWETFLLENLIRWYVDVDLTHYSTLSFYALNSALHAAMGVFVDNEQKLYFNWGDYGWHGHTEWQYFEVDVSNYQGVHRLSLIGGHVDWTGNATSNTIYCDIRLNL